MTQPKVPLTPERVLSAERLAELRALATARCSCTYEAGDSDCERHPSDPETGEPIGPWASREATFDGRTVIALLDALDAARKSDATLDDYCSELERRSESRLLEINRLTRDRDAARKELEEQAKSLEEARGLLAEARDWVQVAAIRESYKNTALTPADDLRRHIDALLSRTPEGSKPCGDAGKTGGG